MTIAHKSTSLPFKTCFPVDGNTVFLAHYDITLDESLRGINPDAQIASLLPNEGKFGGGVSVEEASNNLIPNGHFANGEGVTSESGSNPTNTIVKFPNPGHSEWVLRQSGGASSTEYEIHPKSGSSLTVNAQHTMSCWVAYTPDYNGSDQIFHARVYYTDGTETVTVGKGTLLYSIDYGGLKWEKRYLTFTVANKAISAFNWYFGYPTSNTLGYRYATDLQLEQKAFPTSFMENSRVNNLLQYPLVIPENVTISFWVKSKYAHKNGSGYLFDTRSTDGNGFGMHQGSNGTATFFTRNSANTAWEYLTSSAIVADGTYHHVAVSVEKVGSNFVKRLYVDGNYQGSNTVGIYSFGSMLSIGGRYNNAEWTNGIFDEVRVDERVVPSDEIKEWYLSNAPFYPKGIHRIYG